MEQPCPAPYPAMMERWDMPGMPLPAAFVEILQEFGLWGVSVPAELKEGHPRLML